MHAIIKRKLTLNLRGGGAKWQRVEDLCGPKKEKTVEPKLKSSARVKDEKGIARRRIESALSCREKDLRRYVTDPTGSRSSERGHAVPKPKKSAPKTPAVKSKEKPPPSSPWYASKAASANATLSSWVESDRRGGLSAPGPRPLPPRYLRTPVQLLPPTAAILKRPARRISEVCAHRVGLPSGGVRPPPKPELGIPQPREPSERERHSNWRGRWRRLWRAVEEVHAGPLARAPAQPPSGRSGGPPGARCRAAHRGSVPQARTRAHTCLARMCTRMCAARAR
jgi:hypothetical protein